MKTVSARIKKFNAPLLADKVKLKYQLMSESMFRFYRGTCHLFYEDLGKMKKKIAISPLAWISGDLHIENFGSYKANNQLVYFDLNDFDEALLAPALWEVLRMVTSIFVAFYTLKIKKKQAEHMAAQFIRTYAAQLSRGKATYIEPQTAKGIVCTFLQTVSARKQKELLIKRTTVFKGKKLLMIDNEKHFVIEKTLKKKLITFMNGWIRRNSDSPYHYKVKDVVFRLAGTGSVGVKRYLFLLRNLHDKTDYLLLDMKQAVPSSLLPYVKVKQPKWSSEAQRVLEVADRMQSRLPALFSTGIFEGDSYVMEEMQSTSDKVNFELIKDRYRDVYQVIDDMAMLTAAAQLRSAGRQGSVNADKLIAFGKRKDKWQPGVMAYAMMYAQKVKQDYTSFVADLKSGLL
jgi:uncharacterized protein (DUF2252 family)